MSLFVAIAPPLAVRDHLEDAIHRARRPLEPIGLHWQPADRWHVTMAFLGEQDDHADEIVVGRVDTVAAAAWRPRLELADAGCFNRQVLWVGVRGNGPDDDEAFARLARSLHSGLRTDGFTLERRAWQPHLTVARTRGGDARPAVPYLSGYVGTTWHVDELLVVRSDGGPHPRHTVIHRARLQDS